MLSSEARNVVILTYKLAQEVDGVIDLLRSRRVTVTRVNLCDYPNLLTLSVSSSAAFSDNITIDPTSVGWLHSVSPPSAIDRLRGLSREVAFRERDAFLEGNITTLSCAWLNGPSEIRLCSNKITQLHRATQLGIAAPDYVVTNSNSVAKEFVCSTGDCVIKSLSSNFITYGDKSYKFYTRRAPSIIDEVYRSLRLGPIIIQREIKRLAEIRVVIVDDNCFSVRLDCSDLPSDIVDIRQLNFGEMSSRFSAATGTSSIEKDSLRFLRSFGLSCGAFDWVEDMRGDFYFLECNPLGSFKWTEIVGSFPISEAIVDALINRLANSV